MNEETTELEKTVDRTIASVEYIPSDRDNDSCILTFTDGSSLTIIGQDHNDSTAGVYIKFNENDN